MMKRILRLTAFLLGLTLLLSACGNTKGKEMVDASTQTAPPVEGVTALALCDGDVTLRFEKDETGAWTWFDDPAFPLDQTALEDLLALPAALDSGEAVANVQELAVYGLEAPKKYITVTSDGVDVVYYLGDQAADGRWYVLTPAGTCSPLPVRCAIPLTKIRCCSAAASTPWRSCPFCRSSSRTGWSA